MDPIELKNSIGVPVNAVQVKLLMARATWSSEVVNLAAQGLWGSRLA